MGAYFTLESNPTSDALDFAVLKHRLLQTLRSKLDNGEFTERGLARLTGISQPQIHNLLKGARRLNQESADTLLAVLRLSILDLLTAAEVASCDRAAANQSRHPLKKPPAIAESSSQLTFEGDGHRKNLAGVPRRHFDLKKQAS